MIQLNLKFWLEVVGLMAVKFLMLSSSVIYESAELTMMDDEMVAVSVGQTSCPHVPVASDSSICYRSTYLLLACTLANVTCTVMNIVTTLIFIIVSLLCAFFLVVVVRSFLHALVAVAAICHFQHTPAVQSDGF